MGGFIRMKLFVMFFLMLTLVVSASAAIEVSEDSVNLEVDYGNFNDEDQEELTATTETITLTNTDAANEITVTVDVTGLPTDYSLVAPQEVTIAAGGTADVSLQIDVPHEENSGEKTIGTVTISESSTQLTSLDLVQNTTSMVELIEVSVDYIDTDDDSQDDDFDENDLEMVLGGDVLVGTEMTIYFEIKNLFNDNYKNSYSELEKIKLEIDPSDKDLFTEDFDEKYDFDDLDADHKDDLSINFMIDDDAETQEYSFDITLKAEDGKNVDHEIIKRTLTFDVERKSDDLKITKAELSPSSINACDTSFSLDLELQNLGTSNQRDAAINIYNQELGISESASDLRIDKYDDSDDTWSQLFNFNLEDLEVGTYNIDVNAFIDEDEPADFERLSLVVGPCLGANDTNDSGTTEVITSVIDTTTTPSPDGDNTPVSSSEVVQTVENPYTIENLIIGGIAVVIVLIIAIIILFIAILIKK